MANKASRARAAGVRKAKQHFHGRACVSDFSQKEKNPENQRRTPYKAPTK